MKIKIGDKIFDPNDEPIMLILDKKDKENISNMLPEATKYCAFPDGYDIDAVKKFMKTDTVKKYG